MLFFEYVAIAKNYAISFTPQSNLTWSSVINSILQMRKLDFRGVKLLAEPLNR